MATQADSVPFAQSVTSPRLAILVALSAERASVAGGLRNAPASISIVQSGAGAARAGAATREAIASGATAVLALGLAGALDARLEAGAVVLPERIVSEGGDAPTVDVPWRDALRERIADAPISADGVLLSTARVLRDPAEKARAARLHDAIACDMESAAIGAAAGRAGVPFVALRVIADTLVDTLPDGIDAWVDAHGNSRIAPLLGALSRPGQWHATLMLIRRFAVARKVLSRLAAQLAPVAFALPPRVER